MMPLPPVNRAQLLRRRQNSNKCGSMDADKEHLESYCLPTGSWSAWSIMMPLRPGNWPPRIENLDATPTWQLAPALETAALGCLELGRGILMPLRPGNWPPRMARIDATPTWQLAPAPETAAFVCLELGRGILMPLRPGTWPQRMANIDATPTWQLAPKHETVAPAGRTSQENIGATPPWQQAPTHGED
jgi:hypothetical protein